MRDIALGLLIMALGILLMGFVRHPKETTPEVAPLELYLQKKEVCTRAGGVLEERHDVRHITSWHVCVLDRQEFRL